MLILFLESCPFSYTILNELLLEPESINASSTEPGNTPANARLNQLKRSTFIAWAPAEGDQGPTVIIDLGAEKIVNGLSVQGGGSGTNEYVTLFSVFYSVDGEGYTPVLTSDMDDAVSLKKSVKRCCL